MGKSCWMASIAIQQLFPIQILLPFPIFKLLPNFIFECYKPQTWQFYLFVHALFISSTHKVPGLKWAWARKVQVVFIRMTCLPEVTTVCMTL